MKRNKLSKTEKYSFFAIILIAIFLTPSHFVIKLFSLTIYALLLYFFVILPSGKENKKNSNKTRLITNTIAKQQIPEKMYNRIMDISPNFFEDGFPIEIDSGTLHQFIPASDKESLTRMLYEIYKDIQIARMNFDYDKLRSLTTDELFNNYKGQLDILQLRHVQNIMSDFHINEIMISDIREEEELIAIDVNTIIDCYDYIVDTKTGWVTRGNKYEKVAYNYKLTFIGSNEDVTNTCPNCGAELPSGNSTKCEHCNSVVVNKTHNWVLSREKIISRISRYKNHFLEINKALEVSSETFGYFAPDYDRGKLLTLLYDIYREVNFSFATSNLDTIKALTTDELFNSYKNQLIFLKQSRGQNIMKDFHLFNAVITDIKNIGDNLSIELAVVVGYYDYVINRDTKQVIIGNKEQRIIYNYRLHFIGYANKDITTCSNCGASTKGAECPHCKTITPNNNHKWLLSEKKIITKIRDE